MKMTHTKLGKQQTMNPVNDCRFCALLAGSRNHGAIDTPIMESRNYSAITSLGAFIEGWTLILPKKHQLNCAPDFNSPEFLAFTQQVKNHIENIYGASILFEHGAETAGSLTGCGIDHAHIHIVPSMELDESDLQDNSLTWNYFDSEESKNQRIKSDYLLYIQNISNNKITGKIAYPISPISQFFRKVLANKHNFENEYNYKTHHHIESANKSHSMLKV